MIKSISYDQHEILEDIIKLYSPQGIELDPTYSTGGFYKKGIKEPLYKYDIKPASEGVIKADCRNLPLEDNSIGSILFDPPFLATTGPSLKKHNDSNKINQRFGVYKSEEDLKNLYYDSLKEFNRILKKDGILIFKCQDKVSSGKQVWNHCWVYETAKEWYKTEDLFVLLAKNRLVADWQLKNQKHARKFHCFFWVFKKYE